MSDRVLGISHYGRHLIALREELAGRGVRCAVDDRGRWTRLRIYCPGESDTAQFDNNVVVALVDGEWCFCWPSAVPIGAVSCLAAVASAILIELGLDHDPDDGGAVQAVVSLYAWRRLSHARQSIARPRTSGG